MNRKFLVLMPITVMLSVACGLDKPWDWSGNPGNCLDPGDRDYDKKACIEIRCKYYPQEVVCDGGVDDGGSSSSSSSGSSAVCSGTCVANAPNDFAEPQLVYVGAPKAKYSYSCPDEVGAFGGREYRDLITPNPGCPSCICGPIEGSCNARPNNIMVRAGTCDVLQPATTNFGAPENWDGACTNVNAVSAGLECPPGSGIPCAQSVYSSTLLDPEQGCEAIPMPVPNLTNDRPRWSTMVLSCSSTPLYESCKQAASTQCLPALPEEAGWRYCVKHDDAGVHACPSSIDAPFTEQVVAYSKYIDERKCTECTCKASGGECYGTLRVYKDNSCSTNELVAEMLSSDNTLCSNLFGPGDAIGSKEMTGVTYLPGKCEPKGGLAIGTAYPDETTAVTWCCMPAPIEADAGTDANME